MNLISCDNCGIVLDKSKLKFPEEIYHDDGSVDLEKAIWFNRDYKPYVLCPVCKAPVTE